MDGPDDLDRSTLSELLPGRPLRTFPAMLSTEAEARSWAGSGAPDGAVVVAGYQAAPRGRSGLSWADEFQPGRGLGCSVVLRPDLAEEREGWLYATTVLGVHDVLAAQDDTLGVEWPDRVVGPDDDTVAAVGTTVEPAGGRLRWAVVTILVPGAAPPRGPLLAALVDAVVRRSAAPPDDLAGDYARVCRTFDRRVLARLLPLGPAAPSFVGVARDLAHDGGLVIATDDGPRIVVQPQALGFLEAPDAGPMGPAGIG